jgi:hypothetical protein
MIGVVGERVRQLEMRALEKLRAHGIDLEAALATRPDADEDAQGDVDARAPRERVRIAVSGPQLDLF